MKRGLTYNSGSPLSSMNIMYKFLQLSLQILICVILPLENVVRCASLVQLWPVVALIWYSQSR